MSRKQILFCLAAVAIGISLRMVWLSDMEYKADQRNMYVASQKAVATGEWPALGEMSSAGIRQPAWCNWIFIVVTKIFAVRTPLELGFAIRAVNSIALLLLFFFAWKLAPVSARTPWAWTLILASVNPFFVIYQRVIWAQSILPIFCVAWLIGIHYRQRWWGALLAGFSGLLMAQIHMSGLFLVPLTAAALFVAGRPGTRWLWAILGAALVSWPLLAWFQEWRGHSSAFVLNPYYGWGEVFRFRYWRYWFTEPLGIKLSYWLGDGHYSEFMRYPLWNGRALYLTAILHLLATILGCLVFGQALRKFFSSKAEWRRLWKERDTDDILIFSTFVVYGLVLSLYTLNNLIYRHYLIVAYPLTILFFVKTCLRYFSAATARRILSLHFVVLTGISLLFLLFIHEKGGTINPDAEYGVTYGNQNHDEK